MRKEVGYATLRQIIGPQPKVARVALQKLDVAFSMRGCDDESQAPWCLSLMTSLSERELCVCVDY